MVRRNIIQTHLHHFEQTRDWFINYSSREWGRMNRTSWDIILPSTTNLDFAKPLLNFSNLLLEVIFAPRSIRTGRMPWIWISPRSFWGSLMVALSSRSQRGREGLLGGRIKLVYMSVDDPVWDFGSTIDSYVEMDLSAGDTDSRSFPVVCRSWCTMMVSAWASRIKE